MLMGRAASPARAEGRKNNHQGRSWEGRGLYTHGRISRLFLCGRFQALQSWVLSLPQCHISQCSIPPHHFLLVLSTHIHHPSSLTPPSVSLHPHLSPHHTVSRGSCAMPSEAKQIETLKFAAKKVFTAGPCKEMGASCLKKLRVP